MDILHLVDRLEELFNESRSVPFTHSVMVDEERILDIIDQMRVSIPEEIKKAQQLLAQRDRILAQAKEEAERTVSQARENRDQIVERDAIVEAAHARAQQIIDGVHDENEKTKREADEYVLQKLTALETELDRILAQVRNGIRTLESDKQAALTGEAHPRDNNND